MYVTIYKMNKICLNQLQFGVCACTVHVLCPSGFVQAITSTFIHRFQKKFGIVVLLEERFSKAEGQDHI